MKKMVMAVAALGMLLTVASCSPKKSAYRQAYEQAKQREIAADDNSVVKEETPMVSEPSANISIRKERLQTVEGENEANLRQYSVVVGSFQNEANAKALKTRMTADGYNCVLAKNEFGMVRVIVASFNSYNEAAGSRDAIKARYAPEFSDAWLLERSL
ncbi:cell division protein [Porphyromonas macacae]|uniref:Cell division protein n=2 Tax=Porphyromonas macacae TaxID=28115 RepID=A0A0A2EC42_9PORP|nr:SPOR domain-containing protein [Porphyromonas macacae]KGN75212.1 cell division protein [Porphyromonas macacae]KGN99715.1 cell division protein [Porphyromonas macacae]